MPSTHHYVHIPLSLITSDLPDPKNHLPFSSTWHTSATFGTFLIMPMVASVCWCEIKGVKSQEGVFLVMFCLVVGVLGQQEHQSLQLGARDIHANLNYAHGGQCVYIDKILWRFSPTLVIEVWVVLSQISSYTQWAITPGFKWASLEDWFTTKEMS